jgi:hypothetical protein
MPPPSMARESIAAGLDQPSPDIQHIATAGPNGVRLGLAENDHGNVAIPGSAGLALA